MSDEENTPETPTTDPDYISSPSATTALRSLIDQERKNRESQRALEEQQYKVQHAENLANQAKADPVSFLERSGMDRDAIAQRLQGSGPDPIEGLKSELTSLRSELQQQKQMAEQVKMQAAVDEARSNVKRYVGSSEEHPLVQAADAGDMVWQVMTARHQQTGQLMSEKDAASEVEAYLEKLVTKALDNEKTRGKFQQGASAPTTPNPGPPTLSNQQTSGNASRPATLSPSMDRDLSLQEAAKLIEWSK